MPISDIQHVIPLSSLSVIITGMTFSYIATASESNVSLSNCSSSHASSGSRRRLPSWFKIDKWVEGVAVRMSWYTFFEKNIN